MSREAPWGYDKWTHTQVIPKRPPWRWRVGPVTQKLSQPPPGPPGTPPTGSEAFTVQLTADQQVELSISGQDNYGNPVEITGNTQWKSSDEAAVTVSNDVNNDGTGDYIGSLAVDVVAGVMKDIAVTAGTPTNKPS